MPKGPELTTIERSKIIALRDAGLTFSRIGEEVGRSSDTCQKTYLRYSQSENYNSAQRSGHPKILNEHDARHIKRHICHDKTTRRQPLGEININLNLNICNDTLKNFITTEIGLKHRIARKCPHLSSEQKKKRLQFAKTYLRWGLEEWRRMGFTDEMLMQTSANQGQVWIWRFEGEEYLDDCCSGTVQPGFEKIKVWGAIRYGEKVSWLYFQRKKGDGKMTAQEYVEFVMDGEMLDFWEKVWKTVDYYG